MTTLAERTESTETSAGADLNLSGISKRFASFTAVEELDLLVPSGTFFALLGPSGCGKSTTLRMIAGLEAPSEGSISIGGQDVTALPSHRRPVNTVFQSYALFPHMSVLENVAFGLKRKKDPQAMQKAKAGLELVELSHLANRKPAQLSGGQQQRVALARALVNRPQVLLLDEPLGALDMKLRRQMQLELKKIQTEVGLTFIHVTHDQEEAMTMADVVAVMNGGRIEQMGAPRDLYELPRTAFVANFLGKSNLMRGMVTGQENGMLSVDVSGRTILLPAQRAVQTAGEVVIGVRPEKITIDRVAVAGDNQLSGTVIDVSFTGTTTEYLVEVEQIGLIGTFSQNRGQQPAQEGDTVFLAWDAEHSFGLAGDESVNAGVES
ncbi:MULTISPECIES: ABC transporter ATP-binding protein [Glutamicibacter]|uniref:Spermidine/putrescine import ATP-binding protein PotA n=1 Tax=Glutamicibacter halophytocola TaxID=1933880 RepID=A0A5B8IIS2_9MICC|nr:MULTISPECIES: ABC transporter ATP-binding protein [Glutamicibacter]ALG29867.1 spermidine/putrescine ABC transporter ATP-binding protein [Glutamicibacter halophytocola]MBF6672934.1 ABC transporter ATP-binding protein [Glutamicibacter sp. FBE19]NQD41348.1 ABC transporter ATP-binding protein [Glutamicibacter halophytocola]QDY66122.1 ABC transporter ATP-binding protein [Glutamicibacter halophytocola]UUX58224.1 ABC transporter ATP-binding protein [Glutamicibacter halophytocola]